MSEPLVVVEEKRALRSLVHSGTLVSAGSARALKAALLHADEGSVWVARAAPLVRWVSELGTTPKTPHRLLLLGETDAPDRTFLRGFFREVVAADGELRILELPALMQVLTAERRKDLLIGAAVARLGRAVILYRGNLETLVVPFAWFIRRPGGPKPDFRDVEVIDHGQTLRLGAYEAATDALLYEFDPAWRREARLRHLAEDRSFGASLRRLRLQRGLRREDFGAVSAKTVARIERGEVSRPHGHTLAQLAHRLGVKPEEIGTY